MVLKLLIIVEHAINGNRAWSARQPEKNKAVRSWREQYSLSSSALAAETEYCCSDMATADGLASAGVHSWSNIALSGRAEVTSMLPIHAPHTHVAPS